MKTIHRIPLAVVDQQQIALPDAHKIVLLGLKDALPNVWVELDDTARHHRRDVVVVGTGRPAPLGHHHIGSVLMGDFVWHYYLKTERDE